MAGFYPRHKPEETLYKQLVFALKYEGINLLIFKKLFECLESNEIAQLVQIEPLSQYSRKIWFVYEWLFNEQLEIPDLKSGNFVPLIDKTLFLRATLENAKNRSIIGYYI